MIIYKCKCGSIFTSGKLHTKTSKDGKTKTTYFGSEAERRLKREWKDEHGTRKGYSRQCKADTLIHNPGHGYERLKVSKH